MPLKTLTFQVVMRIAVAEAQWRLLRELTDEEFANLLWEWAEMITLALYRKRKREPKKP
jgi:hypothetical protein